MTDAQRLLAAGYREAHLVTKCRDAIGSAEVAQEQRAAAEARRHREAEQERRVAVQHGQDTRRREIAARIVAEHPPEKRQAAFEAFLADQPPFARRYYANWGVSVCSTFVAERLAPGRVDELLAAGSGDGSVGVVGAV